LPEAHGSDTLDRQAGVIGAGGRDSRKAIRSASVLRPSESIACVLPQDSIKC